MVDNKMQQTIDQSPATHEFDYDFIPQFPSTAIFTSLPLLDLSLHALVSDE
jgi:hypothetical protein